MLNKETLKGVFWYALVGLIAFIAGTKMAEPIIETVIETEIVTKVDTVTVVDTVYVEVIPPAERDTVYLYADDVVDITERETRTITTTYEDSALLATHILYLDIELDKVTDSTLEYILLQRIVKKQFTVVNTLTTKTTTITNTVRDSFFQVGAEAYATRDGYIAPFVTGSYTHKNGWSLNVGFDPLNQGVKVGLLQRF